MKKLNKFNKPNKKRNIIVIGVFLITGLILVGISYAIYQKEDEVKFINAKVGSFEISSSDIELAMTLDGNDITTPPNKNDGYYTVTVECDHADGRWDENEWGAVITNISSNRVKCNVSFETLETLPLSVVELGDYISMTPTATSYTIPTSLTGYTSSQTINPSELNLWRVIKKNEDGTVEVVSEYISSTVVSFYGKVGYLNLVGALNTIAGQYTNEKYVQGTRHMGYSNQIEYCSSLVSCASDNDYTIDTDLVQTVLGTLIGQKTDMVIGTYWISSRLSSKSSSGYPYYLIFDCDSSGKVLPHTIAGVKEEPYLGSNSVRPILTLKSDIGIVTGDGKSAETAFQLSS